ncbi:STAS-like domain-containing protein [Desulfotalea psychrophila]|uniref:STAS-like domain-containing protein n=1 Tax=Desulfotalea psychrophila TaxID=84980 RepID=UPI0002EFD1E6|nr:STAS-like domain-containing protein [Desulfotalea psychrophila]
MATIIISETFTDAPGGRLRSDGPKSGEEFRNDFLIPVFDKLTESEQITIDLDGCFGYATSFLEEVFGGLSREYGAKKVLEKLKFKSDEEPLLITEIQEYIKDASK